MDRAVLDAVVRLAHALRMQVVAEGVETCVASEVTVRCTGEADLTLAPDLVA